MTAGFGFEAASFVCLVSAAAAAAAATPAFGRISARTAEEFGFDARSLGPAAAAGGKGTEGEDIASGAESESSSHSESAQLGSRG